MQCTASLASLAVLILCATASGFVLPAASPPHAATTATYSTTQHQGRTSNPFHSFDVELRGVRSTRTFANPRAKRVRKRSAACMMSTESSEAAELTESVSSSTVASNIDSPFRDPADDGDVDSFTSRDAPIFVGTGADVWNGARAAGTAAVEARGVGPSSLAGAPTAPARTEIPTDVAVVGNPQQVVEKEYSIEAILKELAEIQNQGPKNYCVLGTRHCSFLHQQIIELLAYALVLSGNHVFTSGAMGTNAATIRGALRAERKELLTVVLPQSLEKQSEGSRELIQKVTNVITNPQNDHLPLDAASRLCNSDLLKRTEQLICFAFHDSHTIIETSKEARSANMIVTELYLD